MQFLYFIFFGQIQFYNIIYSHAMATLFFIRTFQSVSFLLASSRTQYYFPRICSSVIYHRLFRIPTHSNYFLFGLAVLCSLNTLTHTYITLRLNQLLACMVIFRMLRLSLVFVFLVFQVCEKDNINTDPIFEQKPCKVENNNKPQISTCHIF